MLHLTENQITQTHNHSMLLVHNKIIYKRRCFCSWVGMIWTIHTPTHPQPGNPPPPPHFTPITDYNHMGVILLINVWLQLLHAYLVEFDIYIFLNVEFWHLYFSECRVWHLYFPECRVLTAAMFFWKQSFPECRVYIGFKTIYFPEYIVLNPILSLNVEFDSYIFTG